jgi:prolyl 4-hydroxylase
MTVLNLTHYVRIYDADLEPDFCRRMIDSFNALTRFHQPNGRGHRAGLEQSSWVELNVTRMSDPGFRDYIRMHIDRALAAYNSDIGLTISIPNSPKTADLILKRYRVGHDEQFQLHFDSIHEVANRYLVLLWYINDVESGGETVFPQLELSVKPQQGRLLMFPPYWMFQHAGLPPTSGEKFILSTYLLF